MRSMIVYLVGRARLLQWVMRFLLLNMKSLIQENKIWKMLKKPWKIRVLQWLVFMA
ncbi:uncharacterized protein DS421_2g39470 [Arachis hypogaea]|nr:uncharacterized protein DS421_2g39470 [Arachis hypogaea]